MNDSGFSIRPYRSDDLDALYDICLKTGDSGEDATRLYDDPKLLGHLYAAPYATLEPDLTFVLEDSAGVCGYILGAFDSKVFDERLGREWFPALREQYPKPGGNPKNWTRGERMMNEFYEYDPDDDKLLTDYPSHLHIDLLPRAQGQGYGRRMLEQVMDTLRWRGSPGAHLGVSALNPRARDFYAGLGFRELIRVGSGDDEVVYMGIKLT